MIGAGFSGYFVSPAVEVELRVLQVGLGFLLLFGLATRVVALATLAVYLVGSGQPSADDVLSRLAGDPETVYRRVDVVYERARAARERVDPYEVYLPTVTRVGLGVTFVSLGASQKLLQPGLALAVVDRYDLTAAVPASPELWVLGSGLAEATLGLALIAGAFTRASAAVAIEVFSLTLFALPDDPVLAHVGLFGMASVVLVVGAGPYSVDNRMATVQDELEELTPSTVT